MIDKSKIERNVRLYMLFKLVCEPILWGPILIMFIMNVSGMKLSEIYFMEACCVIVATLLQVPTGALADRWGRANTVRLGMVFLIMEMISFATASCRVSIWISNTFWAIGYSLISGADSAWLYDSLKNLGRESEYKKITGKASSYRLAIVGISALGVGHIAEINIRLPMVIDSILILCGLIVCFFFKEPPNYHLMPKGYGDHMKESLNIVLRAPKLIWLISFSILIGVTSKLWFFTYNPYFAEAHLPLAYYGYVFAILNGIASLSSYHADMVSKKLGSYASTMVMLSLIVIPIILMGIYVSVWSIPLVFLQNFVRGYMGPFMEHMMHDRIDSSRRATIMSVRSACNEGVAVASLMLFSVVTASLPLSRALLALGITAGIVGCLLIWSYGRVFETVPVPEKN